MVSRRSELAGRLRGLSGAGELQYATLVLDTEHEQWFGEGRKGGLWIAYEFHLIEMAFD